MSTDGQRPDSEEYLARKAYFRQFLTIYGRSAVEEALQTPGVEVARLHMVPSRSPSVKAILRLARQAGVEIHEASAREVSRISRNGRQDQGVAADLRFEGYGEADLFFDNTPAAVRLLALDGVTTPRNVGMIVRACACGGMDGVLIPRKGCCAINPLVIKASAGTLFRTRILRCERVGDGLRSAREAGAEVLLLEGGAERPLFSGEEPARCVYVLGSEGEGVGDAARAFATGSRSIPMAEGCESLNVAMAATLVAYRGMLRQKEERSR